MFDRIRAAFSAFRSPVEPVIADDDWKHWNRGLKLIKASFEAGLPRDDLWTLADFRDADATLKPHIRRRIRSRGRYERANNPLVDRVVNVFAEDVVGEGGPWMTVASGNDRVNSFIETAWARWWTASNQAGKLRTAVEAESVDGEAVGLIHMNPEIVPLQHPLVAVATDVAPIECDRLASPTQEDGNRRNYIDGVHLHPGTRVPVAYDLLKAHPGTEYIDVLSEIFEADTFPASEVLHAFRQRRPEQHRGNCRYVSALPIAGYLRKYLEADVNRQALRAAYAFMLESTAPGDQGEEGGSDESQWWQQINMPGRQGIGTVLPDGYKPFQFQASGESAELEAFHRIIAGSVAGCYAMPLGRALGEHKNGGYPGTRADYRDQRHCRLRRALPAGRVSTGHRRPEPQVSTAELRTDHVR
ncbi:phage portal protein [Planctomicrobium sp. SH664]|uniref:phage portal protein n=1 Tax=Planctomicrobium sp. SH664 TaxID=3448125 RepID=UPI003F5BB5AF